LPSNYLDEIAAQIRAAAPPSSLPEADAQALYRLYALLALVKGVDTSATDVHDAWVAWKLGHDPADPDVRPYFELDEATRQADEPFAAAIRAVAPRVSRSRHP
jgi:hypothetical protein